MVMCRKLATLEVYVDKIFTLNTQTTLDMAAQETFNPPWPSLKSLKLGGFVSWPLRIPLFLCPDHDGLSAAVSGDGLSQPASAVLHHVRGPGAPRHRHLRGAAPQGQPHARPRRFLLREVRIHMMMLPHFCILNE